MGYQDTLSGENAEKRNIDGVLKVQLPAIAQGAVGNVIAGVAPFSGKIQAVEFYPKDSIIGANANTRLHTVVKRNQAGGGAVVSASLQYNLGVDAYAYQKKSIPLGAADNLKVTKGDIFELQSGIVGAGLADTGGLLIIKIVRA